MKIRILELRKARNITQQRLAIDIGIDQASISSYESGKYLPNVEILIKISDYFGVSTDYLLGRSESKYQYNGRIDERSKYVLSIFENLPVPYRERAIGYLERLQEETK